MVFSDSTIEMQTDSTLSEDDTDWEDDGIPGLPEDPVIFEYFSNVLQSKDLKVNDSLISPILDPFKRAIVERIMKDFWKIFNQQWFEAIRKCTGTLCIANSSLSGQGSASSVGKSTEDTNKRAREDDDDQQPEEENRDSHKRRNTSTSPKGTTDEKKKFACPYRKHNPQRYNHHSLKWRTCALTPLQTVARVK